MNTKHKFCRGDYCVIKSPKSSNNGKLMKVFVDLVGTEFRQPTRILNNRA